MGTRLRFWKGEACTTEEVHGEEVTIPCGICQKRFEPSRIEALLAHVGGHFDQEHCFNRCEQCQINFVTVADLQKHMLSAQRHRTCGFMFEHKQPCAGHHYPPHQKRGEDGDCNRFGFCYRLQGWEQGQVAAYAERRTPSTPTTATPVPQRRSLAPSLPDILKLHSHRRSRTPDSTSIPPSTDHNATLATQHLLISAALLRAICTRNVDLVQAFLVADAANEFPDVYGFAPMHYAAQSGSRDIARLLLERGFDVRRKDFQGRTPLAHALRSGNYEVVPCFLAAGAEVADEDVRRVVEGGNVECAEMVLGVWESGRGAELRKGVLENLLLGAVRRGDEGMVELLRGKGGGVVVDDDEKRDNALLATTTKARDREVSWHEKELDVWDEKDPGSSG